MCCCMIETSSVPPQKFWLASEIFGNLRKMSEKCSEKFVFPSEQFWEIFGNPRKWSEIFGRSSITSSLVCLYNKQNITCPLVDMKFILSCSYRVEHEKIKFISKRGHVISSIHMENPSRLCVFQ